MTTCLTLFFACVTAKRECCGSLLGLNPCSREELRRWFIDQEAFLFRYVVSVG